jgi:uncharacterized protein YkwD
MKIRFIIPILILIVSFSCGSKVILNENETTFLNLINEARAENNLVTLQVDKYLMDTATKRSNEILNGVFAHNPLHNTIKNNTGVTIMVGEILGKGKPTSSPEKFLNAWLKSPTHRDVILNSKYGFTKVGIGISQNNTTQIVTILFSSR